MFKRRAGGLEAMRLKAFVIIVRVITSNFSLDSRFDDPRGKINLDEEIYLDVDRLVNLSLC